MFETMDLYQVRCKQLLNEGLAYEELENYKNFKNIFSKYEFECIMKERNNRRNKRYRIKDKFMDIMKYKEVIKDSQIVFGTITLDNKHLSQKENTYIRKIHKWLKEHFYYSILNKDFGKKNEREHYHFIGLTTEKLEPLGKKSKKGYEIYELIKKTYDMGFEPSLCLVDLQKNDIKQTVNYLLKLNNHSTKITTKNRIRIIKNNECNMINLLYGIEATTAEKRAKKIMLESI